MSSGEARPRAADGYWDLDDVAAELGAVRRDWRSRSWHHAEHGTEGFPSRGDLSRILQALSGALYPLRLGPEWVRKHNEDAFVAETLQTVLSRLYGQIRLELLYALPGSPREEIDARAAEAIAAFAHGLPALRRTLDTDVDAAFRGDPAARSVDEVLICYPSLTAIIHHRIAHRLHELGAPLVARIISEIAHSRTGIDIHPGASIGDYFFIDHGTGVVIGETTVIGRDVRLYQGVTLGAHARSLHDDADRRPVGPRHPIVEDDVVIYAGTTILGPVTIGRGSVIGGNLWIVKDVARESRLAQEAS
ncbi:MAG: serine acetyltransferase [Sphingobium sp.]